MRRGWGGGGNEGDILSALSYVWGRSSRRARVGSDVWQLRIACYSDSAVGAQGVGMAVAWILTNSKRDELLTKIYERYDGHALRMLMDALDGALTGNQLDQLYNGRIVTIDPSSNSALMAISAKLATDLGYEPDDPDVYRWVIDPLINPRKH